ncbi:phage major tail protein, TP901-1 family [Ligilactobacillus equi]|uniref:Phage major tail protein, TP901-1 family n=1 Tax=Ligilactobacillus equi DPC 6820 TaxID=1392007 RepID=V7HW80_9LACO|nr:phage major tail protein, TP901-1 family [Ligilactobacillus equi]ETA74162.1 hypothetical protein LEQ_0541 [Ligilactobacillus equi DPC 6820]
MAEPIEGKNVLDFIRIPSEKGTKNAYPLPLITGSDLDLSRDTDDTQTKDGVKYRIGQLTVEPKVTLLDADEDIIKVLEDSLFNGTELEFWHVFVDKKNSSGLYYSYNLLVKVTELSQSSDSDDFATQEVTFTQMSNVTRGYTPMPESQKALIDYVYRGLEPVTTQNPTGGGVASSETAMPTYGSTSTSQSQSPEA